MKKFTTLFADSYKELKKVRSITVMAMFGALSIVLGSLSVYVTPNCRIGFSTISNEMVHYLFGPVAGGVFGGVLDVLKYAIRPQGPFFPGMTLSAVAGGVIFGAVTYKRPLTVGRVALAKLLVVLVCNLGINTWSLSVMYGDAYLAILPAKVLQNLVTGPVNGLLFFVIAKTLETSGVFRLMKRAA